MQGAMPREKDFKETLCADIDGFSLHAAVRCGADDRQALEPLCRYSTRPPCRPRRASGPTPRQAQTVHWTVCVRARRLHLIRFGVRITSLREVSGPPLRDHGVLAPNAKLRALVVPQEVPQAPEPPAQEAKPVECEANCAHHRPVRLSWAKLLKRVLAAT